MYKWQYEFQYLAQGHQESWGSDHWHSEQWITHSNYTASTLETKIMERYGTWVKKKGALKNLIKILIKILNIEQQQNMPACIYIKEYSQSV